MKRKDRDAILQRAFGELDADQASRADSLIDSSPELAREARALAEMKEGLRGLREIPECQLSVERLRDAILRDEMGARTRPAMRWASVLTPVAATGLAVVAFIAMQGKGAFQNVGELSAANAAEEVVGKGPVRTTDTDLPSLAIDPTEAPPASTGSRFSARDLQQKRPETPSVPFRSLARSTAVVALSSRSNEGASRSAEGLVDPVSEAPAASGEAALASSNPELEPEPPTVVIIHSDAKDETGTRLASEVTPDQHVLIGS